MRHPPILRIETAQEAAELLTSALAAPAIVMDRDLMPLASTGPVHDHSVRRRHADLYVNCMRTGLPSWRPAREPHGEASCGCAPLVACPVLVAGIPAGAIALIPRDAEQEVALRGQDGSVTDLLSVVADLLAGAVPSHRSRPPGLMTLAEYLRAALDSLPDGIIAVDHEGIVLCCNRAALERLGAEQDLTGQPFVHWYPPAIEHGVAQRHGARETTFERRGRRLRFLEAVNPLRHRGRVIGRLFILRNTPRAGTAVQPSHPTLAEAERQLIEDVIARYGTSGDGKRQAARTLGLSLATLYRKLRQYGIGRFSTS